MSNSEFTVSMLRSVEILSIVFIYRVHKRFLPSHPADTPVGGGVEAFGGGGEEFGAVGGEGEEFAGGRGDAAGCPGDAAVRGIVNPL